MRGGVGNVWGLAVIVSFILTLVFRENTDLSLAEMKDIWVFRLLTGLRKY